MNKSGGGKIAVSQRQAMAMGKTPAQGKANRAESNLSREIKTGGKVSTAASKPKKGC